MLNPLIKENVNNHKYLLYKINAKPNKIVRQLAAYLLNTYSRTNYSVSKFRKFRRATFSWKDKSAITQKTEIDFDNIVNHLHRERTFDTNKFNMPDLGCGMLDWAIDAGLSTAFVGSNGKTMKIHTKVMLGDNFPLKPTLDRPGIVASDLQVIVEQNIKKLCDLLVFESHEACDPRTRWFSNFRLLLNECVSVVDMTLNKIHLLAQYRGHEFGWNISPESLGKRQGVRLKDKFKWLGKITGRGFDKAQREIRSFKTIKEVRNHLNHFDPPCFTISMEEIAAILNIVRDVGILLWKIREHLGVQLNKTSIELILIPNIIYNSKSLYGRQVPRLGDLGYASSCWEQKGILDRIGNS